MLGWLIVNRFINTPKFNEVYEWLQRAAILCGVELRKLTNSDICQMFAGNERFLDTEKPDFVLFWDKDTRLARLIESFGIRLYNTSAAIEACDDKAATYTLLNSSVKMPRTVLVPKVFHPIQWKDTQFVSAIAREFSFPIVVKECRGSFGEQVYLAANADELAALLNKSVIKPMLVQEFIESSKGEDIRINVVGGEVVACMYRYSTNGDFRANVTNGGKMKNHRPDGRQMQMALDACRLLGLDFGGVDILLDKDGSPILCEVNSNAHFKNIYDCTGVNVADYIMRHIARCGE